MAGSTLAPLLRKLERQSDIPAGDRDAFLSLPVISRCVAAGAVIAREGDRVQRCCAVLAGFAYRYKHVANGARQIISVHVPGDFIDLQNALFDAAAAEVRMLTPGELAFVPAAAIREIVAARPAIQQALWADTLIDASIFSEWITNIGRRNARARIAHLLCEFAVRLRRAGLLEAERFMLPMSQEQLADATGLTAVHVNRTLQWLRQNGLITSDRRSITISDWSALTRIGDFDHAYLHARLDDD